MATPNDKIRKKVVASITPKSQARKHNLLSLNVKQLCSICKCLIAEEKELDAKITEYPKEYLNVNLTDEIQALHEYNEMKDLTQMVLGYLANLEETTLIELHRRYNLPTD